MNLIKNQTENLFPKNQTTNEIIGGKRNDSDINNVNNKSYNNIYNFVNDNIKGNVF